MAELQSPIFTGDIKQITLPSGNVVSVREINGEDEALLQDNSEDILGLDRFLTAIVQYDGNVKRKPYIADIQDWLPMDRYYAIFKIRLISQGKEMDIHNECSNDKCGHEQDYQIDLSTFDADLGNPDVIPGKDAVPRYPLGNQRTVEMVTSSSKVVRYEILTSKGEVDFLELPEQDQTTKELLKIRNASMKDQSGTYILLKSFQQFSSIEMREIRKSIDENDGSWAPIEKLVCPKCKQKHFLNLLLQPTFFY